MSIVFIILLIINLDMLEAHVFCQDYHATSWTPLGYSCPVNCAGVIEAVDMLKDLQMEGVTDQNLEKDIDENEFDYINDQLGLLYSESVRTQVRSEIKNQTVNGTNEPSSHRKSNISLPQRRYGKTKTEGPVDLAPYIREMHKILGNKKVVKEVQAIFKTTTNFKNIFFRRSDRGVKDEELVEKVTEILKRYSGPNVPFTQELTSRILTKLLGHNTGLRHGFDIQILLKNLRETVRDGKRNAARASQPMITLKSKYCLNVYVPGCFCITGFVESGGQCVLPEDCIPVREKNIRQYLDSIHIE